MSWSWISSENSTVERTASLVSAFSGFGEEPLEDRQRALVSERQDQVGREVVRIDVQHQVGIDPEVERLVLAALALQPSGPALPDGRVLQGVAAARLRDVARVVELLHEGRVDDRDVVPLEVVVHVDLPVALDRPLLARGGTHRLEPAAGEARRKVFQRFGERRGVVVEVDEEEAHPRFEAKLRQAVLFLAEVLDAVELGSVQEPTVERVAPAVVAAAEGLALPLSGRDGSRAVAADVRERAQARVGASGDQERLAGHLGREETAGNGDLVLAADELPGPREDSLPLDVEEAAVVVTTRRERRGRGEARVQIEARDRGAVGGHGGGLWLEVTVLGKPLPQRRLRPHPGLPAARFARSVAFGHGRR